jgi:methylmalonyl-CoA mutase N-terminal domain/subunit
MAILGGHQAIHTAGWDEGHALPSEEASKLSLRTQQILANEAGLCNTIDPLAGSYYVESLTNEIEKRAAGYLEEIDKQGGMRQAIENGYVGAEIQRSSLELQQAIESGEKVIVGVNEYVEEENEDEAAYLQIDQKIDAEQSQKLARIKAERDTASVEKALNELGDAIDRDENLMQPIIEAVRTYATVGEVCGIMRAKWGEYRDTSLS